MQPQKNVTGLVGVLSKIVLGHYDDLTTAAKSMKKALALAGALLFTN
jgi:hypothetical protein